MGDNRWIGISISHFRFRRAFVAQGYSLDLLPFKARLFPVGPIFAFAICLFVLVGQGYDSWMADPVSPSDIIACYIGIPIVIIFYAGYKIVKRSKVIPLMEVDLDTGREEFVVEDSASTSIKMHDPRTWVQMKSLRQRLGRNKDTA